MLAVLAGAAILAVASIVASCGGDDEALSGCGAEQVPALDDGFPEPEVRHSAGGELETTLGASYGEVELAGGRYETMSYEGTVPGPTLVVCPGDRLTVHLHNELDDAPPSSVPRAPGPETPFTHEHTVADRRATNLHTHGLHVDPGDNPDGSRADNIFLDVGVGERVSYEYEIPDDHPPGAYWYHPHRHGNVEAQIFAGMLGSIVVAGGLDQLPELERVPVRNLVIHYTQLGEDGRVVPVARSTDEGSELLLNGARNPEIPIRPGELQRWRITNASDNPIVDLALEGHRFQVLAADGNTYRRMRPANRLLIGPSQRREVLVRGGPAGDYELRTRAFSQFQGGRAPAARIATMASAGERVDERIPRGIELAEPEDLSEATVDERHRVVFSERPVGTGWEFLVNGEVFDPDRIDQLMRIDQVQEWTLENATTEWHTFHIHVNNFQVISLVGRAPRDVSDAGAEEIGVGDYQDTVLMPPGKTVTFRTKPTDFTGRFVFHCHMTFHEDHGMMSVVEVTD